MTSIELTRVQMIELKAACHTTINKRDKVIRRTVKRERGSAVDIHRFEHRNKILQSILQQLEDALNAD